MKEIPVTSTTIEKLWKEKLNPYVKGKIDGYKLRYAEISPEEVDEIYIKIVNTLLDPFLVYSGPHRLKQWEKGWGQNFSEFSESGKLTDVSPHYFGKYPINRFNQQFVKGVSTEYEKRMLYVILDYIFDKYLRTVDSIYEFGCGTGHNLIKTREVNPHAKLVGLDWTKASQNILKKVAASGLVKEISGANFDFFKPNQKVKIAPNSAIYTVAALEQIGTRYKPFVSYLLKNKPSICIHVEPIAEMLDEKVLIDNLSVKYFRKRKYLNGYLDYLRTLEKAGKIEIIETKRTYIGSMYIEGYSVIVWRPL